jgi:hypothetical protein
VAAAAAPAVRAPSPEAVQPAPPPRERPAPAGPFAEVAAGEAAGVTYRVLAAEGTQGTTCWKVDSTPAFRSVYPTGDDGVWCEAPPRAGVPLDEAVSFPVDATAGVGFEMLGVLAPPGAALELRLADGTRVAVSVVDPARGFALYVGPVDPMAGFLTVRLGGKVAGCGPGEITEPGEAEGLDAAGRDFARMAPWACLEAD